MSNLNEEGNLEFEDLRDVKRHGIFARYHKSIVEHVCQREPGAVYHHIEFIRPLLQSMSSFWVDLCLLLSYDVRSIVDQSYERVSKE